MRPTTALLLLAMACAVSSCRGEKAAPVAAQEEAKVDGLDAGKWDLRSRMASMDRAQEEIAGEERAEELMREERGAAVCLEYSARTQPPVAMIFASGETCSYGKFNMAKGRISGTMSCPSDSVEPTRFSGHYDAKSFSVTVTKTLPGTDGMSSERTYSTSGKHKGAC